MNFFNDKRRPGVFLLRILCLILLSLIQSQIWASGYDPDPEPPLYSCENPGLTACNETIVGTLTQAESKRFYRVVGDGSILSINTCSPNTTAGLDVQVYLDLDCRFLLPVPLNLGPTICPGQSISSFDTHIGVPYLIGISLTSSVESAAFEASINCGNCTRLDVEGDVSQIRVKCIEDLPDPETLLNQMIVKDSCGPVARSMEVETRGGNGCFGNPITGTYVYLFTDMVSGFEHRVEQLFEVQADAVNPTFIKPDAVVSCVDEIVPSLSLDDVLFSNGCGEYPAARIECPGIEELTNCPGQVLSVFYAAYDPNNPGDRCESTLQVERKISIQNEAPLVFCPPTVYVECLSDIERDSLNPVVRTSCELDYELVKMEPIVIGTGNCNGDKVLFPFTVTDGCGRMTSCQFEFEVRNEGPTINCRPGTAVDCIENIQIGPEDVQISTSCGVGYDLTISGPHVTGRGNCPGELVSYVYTVVDECGQQASCSRVFTILPGEAPRISGPIAKVVECESEVVADFQSLLVATTCGVSHELTATMPRLIEGEAGCPKATYEIIYSAIDDCQRIGYLRQTISLQNEGPLIEEGPANALVSCVEDIQATPEAFVLDMACELGYEIVHSQPKRMTEKGICPAMYKIEYVVMEACNRMAYHDQFFTVESEMPVISPFEPSSIRCLDELPMDNHDFEYFVSCGQKAAKIEITGPFYDKNTPNCSAKKVELIYSVTDECGRMTCIPRVFRLDPFGAFFKDDLGDIDVHCDSIPEADGVAEIPCGLQAVEMSEMQTAMEGTSDYLIIRQYTATDSCGNKEEHTQELYVQCEDVPQISSQNRAGGIVPIKVSGLQHTLLIAPNPASSRFQLILEGNEPVNGQIRVFHQNGNLLLQKRVSDAIGQIYQSDSSDLPKGIYWVQLVMASGEVLTQKLVIQ